MIRPSAISEAALRPENADVFSVAARSMRAAEYVAAEMPFYPSRADFVMRCLPVLVQGIDGKTYAQLSRPVQNLLYDTSRSAFQLAGPGAIAEAQEYVAMQDPRSAGDATVLLIGKGYELLWRAVSIGPNLPGGYETQHEDAIREMVTTYANLFGTVYCELNTMGHEAATAPGPRQYFMSNIEAALPAYESPMAVEVVIQEI